MARLYHKAYRRGAGRRGGYKLASPDPITYANWAWDGESTDTQPSVGAQTDCAYFGTKIRQLVNQTSLSTSKTNLISGYAKKPYECGGRFGRWVVIGNPEPAFLLNGLSQSSPYTYVRTATDSNSDQWVSQVHPRIYFWQKTGTTRFFYCTLGEASDVTTTVWNSTDDGYDYNLGIMGEGCPSNDETRFAMVVRQASGTRWYIVNYEIGTGVIGSWDTAITTGTTPANLNWAGNSQSGEYVVAEFNGTINGKSSGLQVFSADMTWLRTISGATGHVDCGYLEDGVTEVVTWVSGSNLVYTNLATGATTTVISGFLTKMPDYHMSMRSIDRPGYVTLSRGGWTTSPTAGMDVVIQVRLATGEIERWARTQHPRVDLDTLFNDVTRAYGVPSRDGKRVYFSTTQTWRTTTGIGNAHVATYEPSGT